MSLPSSSRRHWQSARAPALASVSGWSGPSAVSVIASARSKSGSAFSPDGLRIVTGSRDKTARAWDAATGQRLVVLRGHERSKLGLPEIFSHRGYVWFAAFSPNGLRIVTGSEHKTARVWDAATGKELVVLGGHEGFVMSAAFSPDGLSIVTASYDKTARIWDAASGRQIAVLRGHEDTVSSVAFSPDGSRVATVRGIRRRGSGMSISRQWRPRG